MSTREQVEARRQFLGELRSIIGAHLPSAARGDTDSADICIRALDLSARMLGL